MATAGAEWNLPGVPMDGRRCPVCEGVDWRGATVATAIGRRRYVEVCRTCPAPTPSALAVAVEPARWWGGG
jgi:hypothetical protein